MTEARVELLDPERRRRLDEQLAAQAEEAALAEFRKYLEFALKDKILTPAEEETLLQFGRDNGLKEDKVRELIETELAASGGVRGAAQTKELSPAEANSPMLDPKADFLRVLRLSKLDSDGMTDDQRDAFVNVAENMGIEPGDAEDIIDEYLEEMDAAAMPPPPIPQKVIAFKQPPTAARAATAETSATTPRVIVVSPADVAAERAKYPNFTTSIGNEMILIPSGAFQMGSDEASAPPNERPVTPITLSRYYLSRHPITNAQYEVFDPAHVRKRAAGAGERHPVVYVSSAEAMKFCQWLSSRERRRFRLPTEAEWEYAARGTDGRKYPWGNQEGRGDLANFADRNTVFAWSDREIDDGFAESSPVGAFPIGVSPFGIEDMAGNVWEWCLDFYETYRGTPKTNPRGALNGAKRVYRGGSWKSRFHSLRTTTRGSNVPSFSCNDLGFRVVCECE